MKRAQRYEYDIALSVAGEDRAYAEAPARELKRRNIRYFYDDEEKHVLWGKNLYPYFSDLYQNRAHYCVIFISTHYASKRWTGHELEAAQARAFRENEEYILPIRLDNTQLPGILPTVSYLEWPPETAETVADILVRKLGREPYVPPRLSVSEAVAPITSPASTPATGISKSGKRGEHAEDAVLQHYIREIEEKYAAGNARELSYRLALEDLLKKLVPDIVVMHEPARKEYGTPDYVISQKTNHGLLNIGYIEAKDVDANLDDIEHDAELAEPKTRDGQQFKRYRNALGNLVLTNYREFRWYLRGERCMSARLVVPAIDKGLAIKRKGARKGSDSDPLQLMLGMHTQSTLEVARLLANFLTYSTEPISSPKELAARMAHIAHIIRDMTVVAFDQHEIPDTLQDLYNAFKDVLIPDLDVAEFADMFAQTLAYGLFAARYNHTSTEPFRRRDAAREIPNTNPFLASLFERITGRDMDNVPFVGFIDDLAQLLAQTDMNAVLADFGKRTRREDPLIHFYETFLIEYDPKLRELRGVYYTPEPVVSYLVRSVDHLLRTQFNCPAGLADTGKTTYTAGGKEQTSARVLLLDPACGTGTFLYAVINHIRERYRKTGNAGMWSSYVREHLLPRIFGFELLMAPYAMAHLKLGMQLAALDLPPDEQQAWSYDFKSKERLGLYLTNTLEEAMQRSDMLFARSISDEANAAARIKQEYPVMVVMGNPPYSGHSANKGQWIKDLLHGIDSKSGKKTGNYFEIDGRSLDERNPKYLNDDYVKFIRFAQWRIEQTGYGILAFITNHGYLDNPTFRGMRQSLMQSFDNIYILDLHGDTKKKERSPDGTRDENIFDIQQGVAIGIFVRKKRSANGEHLATIHYTDLWGARELYERTGKPQRLIGGKYHWLTENDVVSTEWSVLKPQSPFYLFKPQTGNVEEEYKQAWVVNTIFTASTNGFKTHRDHFTVAFDAEELRFRIEQLRNLSISNEYLKESCHLKDTNDWKIQGARNAIRALSDWTRPIVPCLYRPFDNRFCYYGTYLMDRPRENEFLHMHFSNICLATGRQGQAVGGDEWNLITVGKDVADTNLFYRGGIQYFPLYLYETNQNGTLFDTESSSEVFVNRKPNISSTFITAISKKLNMQFIPDGKGDLSQTFGPEGIFNYMYAIFHSLTYRERYAEFLKIDFPRLPLTSNVELFRELCNRGNRLVKLHLLEEVGDTLPSYPQKGNNVVDGVRYTEPGQGWEQGRVWINKEQYFEGVAPEGWNFHVGGYQVCQKWLKDRKGRALSYEDIEHYAGIVANLGETIALMGQIDELIDEHGGWPIV
ncbi:MAG: TIR domain-containing protein [Ktedonobacteraceae bacterium]|nr:TIR domain-containing protein [Ktedonobacteraceae bacterium]